MSGTYRRSASRSSGGRRMPHAIKKVKGGWAIYYAGGFKGGGRAVKKVYKSKTQAKKVARLRRHYAGEE